MSGSLLEIKKQIKGVKNTRKITKAMQLVAASKMRQFQSKALASRDYVKDLLNVLDNNIHGQQSSTYADTRREGPVLYVIYTSDKGLCGALNGKLMKALFRSEEWKNKKESERLLVTIGRKSHEFAKNNSIAVAKHFTGVPEKLDNWDALCVVDGILEFWREQKCSKIVFVAPHYKNSFTFYPIQKTFLPFCKEMLDTHLGPVDEEEAEAMKDQEAKPYNDFMLFNPDADTVVERLHEQIVQALFVQAFMELKAAEYSSRMIAMQNATEAANKMIDELTLTFNKARQAAITREIAELVGAMAAI